MSTTYPPLPADFLFGVACADHQCEAYDSAYPPDVWDWWEERGLVPQPRRSATDFWHRYPEYLALARDLGCTAFRLSLSWARIEPEPGVFDPAVLEHYARLVEMVRGAGMEPVVTLCHYVWPLHLEWDGGLVGAGFPERFARYVEQVRDACGASVRYWLTFNEPNDLVITHSNFNRRFPPGAPTWRSWLDQIDDMETLIRNLFLAHRHARQILHGGPHGSQTMVSMNSDMHGFPVFVQRLLDWWTCHHFKSARRLRTFLAGLLVPQTAQNATQGFPDFLRSLTLLFDGDWWELGMLGQLPTYLCPSDCVDQLDFVAFDFYAAVRWPWQIPRLTAALDGHFEQAPSYAPGLYNLLRYFDERFKAAHPPHGKPILIAENGVVNQVAAYKLRGQNPPRDAIDPATYLREHVRQVQRAHADGVNVVGYLVWSLTSNREWGLRFGPASDFGLYHLDLDGDPGLRDPGLPLHLIETPAAELYRKIIQQRGVGKLS